ncbi:MAG: hypothetical protein U0800_27625 [Isosphaeraceae bacterium]
MRIDRLRAFVVGLAMASWGPGIPAGNADAGDWLTASESRFFSTLGVNAIVNGRNEVREPDLLKLAGIAGDAEPPLRRHIEDYVEATGRLSATTGENMVRTCLMVEGGGRLLKQSVIAAREGKDPLEFAVDAANDLIGSGGLTLGWKIQADQFERRLKAQIAADAAMGAITAELRLRARTALKPNELRFKVDFREDELVVVGIGGVTPLSKPVVQVVLHKPRTNTADLGSLLMMAAGPVAGIEGLEFGSPTFRQGRRLLVAEDALRDLPLTVTCLLPDLERGRQVVLRTGLPAYAVTGVSRIEARLWCREGFADDNEVSGLEMLQSKIINAAENERIAQMRRMQKWWKHQQLVARNELVNQQINAFIANGHRRALGTESARQQQQADYINRRLNMGPGSR